MIERMYTMNSLEQAGEAMLLSYEGNRIIAAALWNWLKTAVGNIGDVFAAGLRQTPGPHQML